jgi:hypothetical protein
MFSQCVICSNKTEQWIIKDKLYFYCSNCNFISLDKKYFVSKKQQKLRYLKHNNNLENKGYVDMLNGFIDIIIKNKKGIEKALDFGSGPNPVLKMLLEKKRIKTDIYDIHFQKNKIFSNKKYDLITMTEVLEHIKNPLNTLKMLSKHLNKEGIIAIMTLFHPNKKDLFQDWWYITDETHIGFYTIKTIEKIAELISLKMIFSNHKNLVFLAKES